MFRYVERRSRYCVLQVNAASLSQTCSVDTPCGRAAKTKCAVRRATHEVPDASLGGSIVKSDNYDDVLELRIFDVDVTCLALDCVCWYPGRALTEGINRSARACKCNRIHKVNTSVADVPPPWTNKANISHLIREHSS